MYENFQHTIVSLTRFYLFILLVFTYSRRASFLADFNFIGSFSWAQTQCSVNEPQKKIYQKYNGAHTNTKKLKICMKLKKKISSGVWTYQQPRVMTIKWILYAARKSSGFIGVLVWGKFSSLKWGQHGFLYMQFYVHTKLLFGWMWVSHRSMFIYTFAWHSKGTHENFSSLFWRNQLEIFTILNALVYFLQNVTNAHINHLFTTFDFIRKKWSVANLA